MHTIAPRLSIADAILFGAAPRIGSCGNDCNRCAISPGCSSTARFDVGITSVPVDFPTATTWDDWKPSRDVI